jgi:outer membrane protein TolC
MKNHFKQNIHPQLYFVGKLFIIIVIFVFEATYTFAQQKLSLEEAIVTTIQHNRRIRIDSAAMGINQQKTRLERGVFLPRVEFNTLVNHYFQQPVAFNSAINTGQANQIGYARPGGKDQASADVSMEMPLLNIAQHKRIESSILTEQQYGFKASITKIDLRAEVKQAYLRILILEKRVQLYYESMDRNLQALKDAHSLFGQGKVTEEDTLRTYLACKNLEPDLLKLQNAIKVSKQTLNLLMGADLKNDMVLIDSITYDRYLVIPGEEQIFNEAMAHKPSIKMLEFDEAIANKNAEVAKKSALPVIKTVGQYALQTQSNGFNYDRSLYPVTSFVGVKMTIPIITGHMVHAKGKIALLESAQAKFRQQVAWKLLGSDLSEILGNIRENQARIKAQIIVRETAKKNYVQVLYSYERGGATRLDLTDAEYTVTLAGSNLIEANYNLELAMIELERLRSTDINI